MEFHEREFFIARICAGYLRHTLYKIVIEFPDADIKYEAQEKYMETYQLAMDDGVFTDKDIQEFLTEFNVWNDKLEEYLTNTDTGLLHQIETFKIQLYQAAFKPTEQEKIRKYLQIAKTEFVRLANLRHQYDYITCHGLATYARWHYVIKNCTFYEDGNLYDWNKTSIQQVMTYFQNNTISDDTHRLLAHTDPWASKWASIKMNGNVFGVKGSDMTDEQSKLLSWTSLYDNIAESPDCPPKKIIDDDDMLDGWLILEQIEREKEQAKKRSEDVLSTNPKIANADEVFVVAQSKDDLENPEWSANINRLNDAQSSMIKKIRLKQVENQGTVAHKDFNDVVQDQRMKANKAYINTMKGK